MQVTIPHKKGPVIHTCTFIEYIYIYIPFEVIYETLIDQPSEKHHLQICLEILIQDWRSKESKPWYVNEEDDFKSATEKKQRISTGDGEGDQV